MDTNLYALEKQVQATLMEARAAGTRAALLASLRTERGPRFSIRAMAATVWTGCRGRLRRASAEASGARCPVPEVH
jgi:hypothetical protein